jgi:Flp pilus assembly protein TadB|nr:MAG TPA: hypothetical protein [Caudoviricetes sp.]
MAVTTAIAVGGMVGYNIYSTEDQKRKANDLQKKKEDQANALAAEQENKDKIAQATDQREVARRRQRMLALGSQGQRDTILTGALGNVTGNDGARKTLLGV